MNKKNRLEYLGIGLLAFILLSSSALALKLTDLSNGLTEDELTDMAPKSADKEKKTEEGSPVTSTEIPEPIITAIEIQEAQESEGAKVNLYGKNLFPTYGSASVSFSGGSVSSFSYTSPTLLIFNLPANLKSGNVTVTASGKDASRTSKGFPFEFHPPEILFVTGDDGIAPGKNIKIWGKYFDGIYFRKDGRAKRADIKNGVLKGGDITSDGNLSVIEMTLPEENFSKDFWVERNCRPDGTGCLKSNTISFENAIPPVLSEWQVNYQAWEVTLYGKNFPENKNDLSVFFDGKGVTVKSYSEEEGKLTFPLPCPVPGRAIINVSYKEIKSNPLLFEGNDSPIINNVVLAGTKSTGKSRYEVSVNDSVALATTNACAKDKILSVGGKEYGIRKFGGKYISDDLDNESIPKDADMYVVFHGVQSNIIPFSKKTYTLDPYIFRIEGKYGFRPGVPFTLFGRNLGSEYLACGQGETKIDGVQVVAEDTEKKWVKYDENGNDVFEEICHRYPPKVDPGFIEAQFFPLEYGNRTAISTKSVSVSVAGKKSNSIEIQFGDKIKNFAQSAPEITKIEYPEGHLPGDKIIIRGNEFGAGVKHNIVYFGNIGIHPVGSNNRGTEITAEIPSGAKSGNLSVHRKTPNVQVSKEFPILISPHPKKELSFSFSDEESEAAEIEVGSSNVSFSFPKISYINSINDVLVNRFRMEIEWEDGNPDNPFSVKESKIIPLDIFTLRGNGISVSPSTVAEFTGKNIILEFPKFSLPLTEGESSALSLDSSVLPFVTDASRFRLKFSPQNEGNFLALNTDSNTGVIPAQKESIPLPWITVKKTGNSTCIDTDDSAIHCRQYEEQIQKNTAYSQEKITNTTNKNALEKKLSQKQGIEQILSSQKLAKEKRVREILEKKEEKQAQEVDEIIAEKENSRKSKLEYFVTQFGIEKARILLAILEKQDAIHTNKRGESSEEKKQKAEKAAEIQRVKEQRAEILSGKQPLFKSLLDGRKDTDRDGLSDAEEVLMGTNPDASDTDRDGYGDFVEVEFGISPLKKETSKIFTDIADAGTAASAISRLFFFGILDGFSDGSFHPNDPVTRATFVSVLAHLFADPNFPVVRNAPHEDVSEDEWFAPALVAARNAGVDVVTEGNSFHPLDFLSRVQACEMIFSFVNYKTSPVVQEFEDAEGKHKDAIIACSDKKLIAPKDPLNFIFGADENITRAEMAVLLYRAVFIQ